MSSDLPVTFELRSLVARGKFSLHIKALNPIILHDPVFCFDSMALDALDDAIVQAYMPGIRLPFPTCLFELDLTGGYAKHSPTHAVCVLVEIIGDGSDQSRVSAEAVLRWPSRRWQSAGIWRTDGKDSKFDPLFDHQETNEKIASSIDGFIGRGCYALHVGNHIEHKDVTGVHRRVMQAKGVRGFQYRIVHVDPARRIRHAHQGGTHSSPRWHERRAHQRRLSSGKVIYVRACCVGKKDDGTIVKDYSVAVR